MRHAAHSKKTVSTRTNSPKADHPSENRSGASRGPPAWCSGAENISLDLVRLADVRRVKMG